MRRIHVANIIEEGKYGGPQVRIVNVASHLKDKVDTTVIIPLLGSEQFQSKLSQCKINYKVLNISKITRDYSIMFKYVLFFPIEVVKIAWYLRQNKFDLIHVSGGAWQYKGVIAAKLSGLKVVWHLNDSSLPWVFRKIFFFLDRFVDANIYASERTRNYYKKYTTSNISEYIIPAPVDSNYFIPADNYDTVQSFSNMNDKIIIGMVANVNPVKGIDVFIKVAERLNCIHSNLQFVVAGQIHKRQEPYYLKLQQECRIRSVLNLEFCGAVDDVRGLLHQMTIYLCTSNAESSPISVWEAMSMGKALVSTDVGDVSKYVIPGISGEIAAIGDVNGLAEKASKLINNSKLRSTYGRRAREIAVNNLDISICTKKHAQLYEDVSGINR